MKKLMTMIAAVATAFGLFAADTPDPSTYYSTSFEANDAGCSDGTTFDWSADDWTTDCTDEFKLADQSGTLPYADGRVRRNEFFNSKNVNNKYLTLATGNNEIKHAIGGADRVFFDQLVKFTGFEEAPVVAEGTKIAVWMSATETEDGVDGATNLYVTAGTGITATNLQIAADVAVDTWYRLTIKSLGNVINASTGMEQAGFLVYIDGQLATIVEGQKDYHANPTKILAPADGFYAKGQLFTAIDTTSATLASVGYQGIGGVDDIIFSKDAPDFAAAVDVTVTPIEGALITVKDADGNVLTPVGNVYTIPQGDFTVTYAPDKGWKFTPVTKDYNTATSGNVIDDSDEIEPQEVVATITRGQTTLEFAESELDGAISQVKDGDVVTFLAEVSFGDDAFTFTKDTTITVTEGGNWAIYVADDTTSSYEMGYAIAAAGVQPEKQITVGFENAENGSIMLGGTIYGNGRVDTLVNVTNGAVLAMEDLTVGGTFAAKDGAGAVLKAVGLTLPGDEETPGTIALDIGGKIVTQSVFTKDDFTVIPEDYEVEITSAADKEGVVWFTYQLKAVAPKTGFMVIISGEPAGTYDTLAAAVEAAPAGATIQLLDDQTVDGICEITKSLTLDLNGNTLSKADTATAASKMIVVCDNATLTIDGTTDGSAAVGGFYAGKKVGSTGNNGNIVVNGGTYSWPGAACVFSSNGKCTDSDITINNATVTSGADIALYFAADGDYAINNSTITGYTAIYQKAGSLAIDATSVITANGDTYIAPTPNTNGADKTGDAIVLDSNTSYAGDVELTLASGAKVNSVVGAGILETVTSGNESSTLSITDNGATITAPVALKVSDKFAEKVASGDANVTGYVATVNGVAYKTAADALLAVQALEVGDNYTIKVVVLADDTAVVNGNQQIILDEGDAITITKNSWVFNNGVTINGTDPIALAEGATFKVGAQIAGYTALFSAPAGFSVKEIANGDGTYTYTTEKIKYHGNYEIWNAADFADLQADVADGETFAGVTFTLINDVTLTEWTGIGLNGSQGTKQAFSGTFNGNGKTLTVSYAGDKKYAGFFNELEDAVVSNLTIVASLGANPAAAFGFAALAGQTDGAVTIADVTVEGTIGTEQIPVPHNAAGLILLSATGTTLIKNCVNNADVYCANNKFGGIACNNNGSALTFDHCVNNGNLHASNAASNGVGGMLGFSQQAASVVTYIGCESNGTITGPSGSNIGSIVGKVATSGNTNIGLTGNKASAEILAVANIASGAVVSGLNFATVAGTTATFVADDALALNGSYKVMAPKAAPTFEFTEAGSISFDTNLVKVADGDWHVTAVAPLVVTPTEVDGIVTFTAAEPIPTFNITIAATVNGTLETSVTNGVEAGTVVTVTATPDTGYELDTITTNGQVLAGKTFEMPAEDVTVAATFKKAGPVYPDDWPTTDPETKAKYVTWATTYAEQMKGLEKQALEEAFLLNCDPTTLATEKPEFKITKIEKVEGEWVVTVKSTNTKGAEFNGKVVTKAFEEVGCKTVVPTPAGTETELFWEAFLVFPAAK